MIFLSSCNQDARRNECGAGFPFLLIKEAALYPYLHIQIIKIYLFNIPTNSVPYISQIYEAWTNKKDWTHNIQKIYLHLIFVRLAVLTIQRLQICCTVSIICTITWSYRCHNFQNYLLGVVWNQLKIVHGIFNKHILYF